MGLRVVRMLAERGLRVVLGSRSVDSGRSAVERLGDLARRIAVRQLDVTDPASVDRLVSWLRDRLGRCDVLVNTAAVLLDDLGGTATTVDLDVVRQTLETNLYGTWRLTQAVAPLMRGHGYGRIVNVSSDLASFASTRPDLPAYRVSKYAVNVLTRMLADELVADGVLVNACCPGSASAETVVWLATLPEDGPTGGFFRDLHPIAW